MEERYRIRAVPEPDVWAAPLVVMCAGICLAAAALAMYRQGAQAKMPIGF
ncbi:MAG: hypothetical protein IKQ60_08755 [Candidatus Methanomethylophilaceae archaeon]|nr:hypothetical protein [Candidatus Methanomethylophilaceae archaeon]